MSWEDQLKRVGAMHVVFAMGFARGDPPRIDYLGRRFASPELDAYNRTTGELIEDGSALFGNGIGFPQDHIDGGGRIEPWVGFKRSIEQVDLMLAALSR